MSTVYMGNVVTTIATGITIPSDGDAPIKAADVNVAFEGLMDGVTTLAARTYTLASYETNYDSAILTTDCLYPIDFYSECTGAGAASTKIDIPNCKVGDVLEIEVSGSVQNNCFSTDGSDLQMLAVQDALGTPVPGAIPGTIAHYIPLASVVTPFVMAEYSRSVRFVVTHAGQTHISILGRTNTASTGTIGFQYGLILRVDHTRPS